MADLSKISVVLPSLDPDEKLNAVIDGLLEYGFSDIILVNDGSKPENLHYFTDAAQAHPEIHVLTHEVNRGKGAGLKTAFNYVLENRPDCLGVVTVDGDNQHHPEDTRACCEHMLETDRITLGCRDFSLPHVPPRSRFGNKTTSGVFKLFCGITLSDTQTGLRAFPRDTLELMAQVGGDRFEYETNVLLAMKTNDLPFDEVKIRTVYIEENKSSHSAGRFPGGGTRHGALCAGPGHFVAAEFLHQPSDGVPVQGENRQSAAALLCRGRPPTAGADGADQRRVLAAPRGFQRRRAADAVVYYCDDRPVFHQLRDPAALGLCIAQPKI